MTKLHLWDSFANSRAKAVFEAKGGRPSNIPEGPGPDDAGVGPEWVPKEIVVELISLTTLVCATPRKYQNHHVSHRLEKKWLQLGPRSVSVLQLIESLV